MGGRRQLSPCADRMQWCSITGRTPFLYLTFPCTTLPNKHHVGQLCRIRLTTGMSHLHGGCVGAGPQRRCGHEDRGWVGGASRCLSLVGPMHIPMFDALYFHRTLCFHTCATAAFRRTPCSLCAKKIGGCRRRMQTGQRIGWADRRPPVALPDGADRSIDLAAQPLRPVRNGSSLAPPIPRREEDMLLSAEMHQVRRAKMHIPC